MAKLVGAFAYVLAGVPIAVGGVAPGVPEMVYGWSSVKYDWGAWYKEREPIGKYTPENNAVTGIKLWRDPNGNLRTFLSVPRWTDGVPSTLNEVVPGSGMWWEPKVLRPYPNARMNSLRTEASVAIRYVQSMEITPDGIMWILDVGRLNILSAILSGGDPPAEDGQPSLLLWDIDKNVLVDRYWFPENVASAKSSFLNDLVVDTTRKVAYISDAGDGAIIVVDMNAKHSWKFSGPSTLTDPSFEFVIAGKHLGKGFLDVPQDGIALSADTNTLFHCALHTTKLYSVPTAVLRQGSLIDFRSHATLVGDRGPGGTADGMLAMADGSIFMGSNGDPKLGLAVYGGKGDPSKSKILGPSRWVDTFGFDNTNRELYWTENNLDLFFTRTMNFSSGPNFYTKSGHNFVVHRIKVNTTSYLYAQQCLAGNSKDCELYI